MYQAAVFHHHGAPQDVVQIEEQEEASLAAGQVTVTLQAASINPSDLLFIAGEYGIQPEFPARPGFEGVGVVTARGSGLLGRLLLGKRVCVLSSQGGSWGEQVNVDARRCIPIGNEISDAAGATFFVNPATAYLLTRRVLNVPRGSWLLQTAAASSVGKMVVRLGHQYGFRTLNVVRRREQAEALKNIGADVVVEYDSDQPPEALAEQVFSLTAGRGVGYAIDPVGGATGSAVVSCLAPHGRLVVYGTLDPAPLSISPRTLMHRQASVTGFWLGPAMEALSLPQKLLLIRKLRTLHGGGILETDIAAEYPLSQLQAAIAAASTPGRMGKVLLKLGAS